MEKSDASNTLAEFPNIERSWLEKVNEMLGLLKARFSGNAIMCTTWNGGHDIDTEWTIKQDTKHKTQKLK